VTSRERTTDIEFPTHIVSGIRVAQELTWLYDLYCGQIRSLAQRIFREPVSVARLPQHGIRLQIQRGASERYECHVDTVPITGLFYVTDHPVGSGGELVVANRGNVRGQEQVDADATYIHPVAGHLILFDARNHTHYVARLKLPTGIRVVVPMAFYTASCSEDTRPADLNDHLGLE